MIHASLHIDRRGPSPPRSYKAFVIGSFCLLALGVLGFATLLWLLGRIGVLPPPPLTANACMDEKFKFLAERDLRGTDLIAVGSSVTWRNLDVGRFERAGLATKALNAAPCYLHLSETAYYTEFLLTHMKHVEEVVAVLAPRDFEQCASPKDEFFSTSLAGAYVFGHLPSTPIYLANLKPKKFVRDIFRIKAMRNNPLHPLTLRMDGYGNGPLRIRGSWMPEPAVADMCFSALSELESVVHARGAQLIVASFPMHPDWLETHDPDGQLVPSLEARMRAALRLPTTLFFSGDQADTGALEHADAVHLLWDSAIEYTHRLTDLVAAARKSQPGHRSQRSTSGAPAPLRRPIQP